MEFLRKQKMPVRIFLIVLIIFIARAAILYMVETDVLLRFFVPMLLSTVVLLAILSPVIIPILLLLFVIYFLWKEKRVETKSFIKKHKNVITPSLALVCVCLCVYGIFSVCLNNAFRSQYGVFKRIEGENFKTGIAKHSFFEVDKDRVLIFSQMPEYCKIYELNPKTNKITEKTAIIQAKAIIPLTLWANEVILMGNSGEILAYDYTKDAATQRIPPDEKTGQNTVRTLDLKNGEAAIGVFSFEQKGKSEENAFFNVFIYDAKTNTVKRVVRQGFDKDERLHFRALLEPLNNGDFTIGYYTKGSEWWGHATVGKILVYSKEKKKAYTLEINERMLVYRDQDVKLMWLQDNKFLVESKYGGSSNGSTFRLYKISENEIKREKKFTYENNANKFGLRELNLSSNYIAFNPSQIIFFGGEIGSGGFSMASKECYLYDIDKDEIILINNFPYNIRGHKLFKTSDNIVFIADGRRENFLGRRPLGALYKFTPGKKIKQKQ